MLSSSSAFHSSAPVASPTWMSTPGGQWLSGTQYTGVLAVASGTVYYRPFDPAQTVVSPIGLSTLALTGTDTLTFTAAYNIGAGDTSQSFNLTRFKF